jgi:alkylhydroperoxidase family enzyme
VYRAWRQLNGSIRDGMDARRYELVTTAAAAALHSSYCTLAHGRILARDHLPPADVAALVTAPDAADIPRSNGRSRRSRPGSPGRADKIEETDIDTLARVRARR